MRNRIKYLLLFTVACTVIAACNGKSSEENKEARRIMKGLYVFGPEFKTFTVCKDGREFWVLDSIKTLELSYSNLNFEKPYEPVYVELEGIVRGSTHDTPDDYDSTIVVTKLIAISKTIPDGPCSR